MFYNIWKLSNGNWTSFLLGENVSLLILRKQFECVVMVHPFKCKPKPRPVSLIDDM